jgi:hypothetical protein
VPLRVLFCDGVAVQVARAEFVGRRAVASGELGQHRAGVAFDVAVPSLTRDR